MEVKDVDQFVAYTDENAFLFLNALRAGEKIVNIGREFLGEKKFQLDEWCIVTNNAEYLATLSLQCPDRRSLRMSAYIEIQWCTRIVIKKYFEPKEGEVKNFENGQYKMRFFVDLHMLVKEHYASFDSTKIMKMFTNISYRVIWNIH